MATSKKPLKLLLVDDSEDDRQLILMNLRRGGYNPDVSFADTKEGFKKELEEKKPDLIICDYSMPGFDGLTALAILKEDGRDIPFILVSGAIGEELAVKAMKAGANDYMMKDNLQRLVPAIERELKEAKMREKHRQGEIERDRLLSVIQNSLNEIYIFDCQTLRYQYLNRAALSNLGYSANELYEMTPVDIIADLDTPAEFNRIIQPLLQGERDKDIYFTKHVRNDGSTYPTEVHLQLIRQHDRSFFTAIGFDLSDREKDARRIKEHKKAAREMAEHSRHKSQFLANMSHELRTPLNSILLLSKLLLKSSDDHLTAQQLKYIDVIQQSGKNLLSLINEVLDLSKIESGEMELSFEPIELQSLVSQMSAVFSPIAEEKDLEFSVSVYENCPEGFISDQLRVEQVVRNLLSNAMKFTEKGRVELDVYTMTHPEETNSDKIVFAVKDTGIGIPKEKQDLVFESFRQADGSTQRKYGGTGLGLSICRQLAELLGGTLTLESSEDIGSTFMLTIPLETAAVPGDLKSKDSMSESPDLFSVHGEPETVSKQGTILLVSDSDALVGEFASASKNFEAALKVVKSGDEALENCALATPLAVFIDPYASKLSGWSIAKQIQNKMDPAPPIWMVSDRSRPIPNVELEGINGTITLPLDKSDLEDLLSSPAQEEVLSDEKTLLLIDDNAIHNEALAEFAEMVVDRCLIATSAGEAYKTLETHSVDCIVLDLTLPDSSGKDVLKKIKETDDWSDIPVIIYSGRSLTPGQKNELLVQADDVILKNIGSHSKLMKRLSQLLEGEKKSWVTTKEPSAANKTNDTVLVVDDDDQSFFSISSLLESNGHRVRRAVSGRGALQILGVHQRDISLVLLDLMMPDMDGYQTIRKIRQEKEFKSLPVFIVTAKAMKGDREECLRHGATDYISKPVSPEKLEKLMSIWMD